MRTLPIRDISRDPAFQVRERLDPATVERYARVLSNGLNMPPVSVALVRGVPVLVDGWHRITAHERCGIREVPAVVVATDANPSEVLWIAAEANLKHGLRLKPKEVRVAFRAFIRARKHIIPKGRGGREALRLMPYREIAQALGGTVSHGTVFNWMRQDFPKIAARYGAQDTPWDASGAAGRLTTDDPEEAHLRAAMAAVDSIRAATRGVKDAERRGEVIGAVEAMLAEMRSGGEWRLPEPLEF
ncbi:ParB N-terminal domain-containing protein [Roseicella aerolata]|uniref:ParB N-terminal domain-containing protein n=1 Tax=Roseicella aerolata TaxID=2883479 RepID=A0A9X1L838_9PROT|nr:ParB N-terminal domain-containing protein [Roseicella aerolata]MCB4822626.1 ParB N-terminal domain-containing protein [Roseicella aerolata]